MKRFSDAEEAYNQAIRGWQEAKGYKDADRVMAYTSSSKQIWKDEADAFIQWCDDMFEYCFIQLEKIVDQERDVPSVQEFLNELPEMQWPS